MISKECVEEERWVSPETFKKTLAVYQVLPGPEAHELCVYFGRLRGGKLGGFLAGLGFMLPGFLLMLGLSILYVEANLAGHLDEVFYGLKAAVGRDRRPRSRPPQPQLHHRRSARSDRRRRFRADPLRRRQLRRGAAWRRTSLRVVDERTVLDRPDARPSRSAFLRYWSSSPERSPSRSRLRSSGRA